MTRPQHLLSVFTVILVTTAALASALKHRPGSVTWSQTAGTQATNHTEVFTEKDYYAIQALKLWEFDRRICSLQLEQGGLNAPGSGVLNPVKVCEPKLTQDWKRADVGASQFVTGIAVCTAKGKDARPEVHGVELWGSAFANNAKLKAGKKPVRLEFAKCEKWSQKRSCPPDTVAVALRAYTNDAESGVVGIELGCQGIDTTP